MIFLMLSDASLGFQTYPINSPFGKSGWRQELFFVLTRLKDDDALSRFGESTC